MLKELKFVQGSVAKKTFIPELNHFNIKDGKVRGYNGMLALCSPIPFDIDCVAKAEPLVKAIQNCVETPSLSMNDKGKLIVCSGSFKAIIECITEDGMHAEPDGNEFDIDGEALLKGLKIIYPFIGDDASRPWSNGVLLRNESVFATNNITLVEYWAGTAFPMTCNIPRAAVKEMLRINEAPTHAQATESSITFHYTDGRWVRSQLLGLEWPDLYRLLDKPSDPCPIDERIFEATASVKSFVDKLGRLYFGNGQIRTHKDGDEGASYDMPDLQFEGIYQIEMISLLQNVVTDIDWSTYPGPCMFFGEEKKLRGAIIGMRP